MDCSYSEHVLATIRRLKQGPASGEASLPVQRQGRLVACLEPVTWGDVDQAESIALLARWRQEAADAFPSQFPVTWAGTQRWLIKSLLEVPDRLLFWVRTPEGTRIAHVGLFRFNFTEHSAEIDNVVRGVAGALPGVMYDSLQTLLAWSFQALHMDVVFLRVFSDNPRALRLYERCGFRETLRVPLARVQEGDVIRWVEVNSAPPQPSSRSFVTMRLPCMAWLLAQRRETLAA